MIEREVSRFEPQTDLAQGEEDAAQHAREITNEPLNQYKHRESSLLLYRTVPYCTIPYRKLWHWTILELSGVIS